MDTIKNNEFRIECMVEAAIMLCQDLPSVLHVNCRASHFDLLNEYRVIVFHYSAFDNGKNEEFEESKEFSYKVFGSDALMEVAAYIDTLVDVQYDYEYNSKQAKLEFDAEMKFESARGN